MKRVFPSSPSHPPEFTIYCTDGDGKKFIVPFVAMHAAKHFLDILCGDAVPRWLKGDEIDAGGVRVKCDRLEDIVEYKFHGEEASWKLPQPYLGQLLRFVGRETAREAAEEPAERPRASSAPDRPAKAAKPPRGARSSFITNASGLVTISDIAEELSMEPRVARGILRGLKIDKPGVGWAWPRKEADAIRAKIKGASK